MTAIGLSLSLPAAAAELRVQQGIEGPVHGVAFTPDGQHFVAGGQDRTIRLFEVASGMEIRVFAGHESSVQAVAVTPDGRTLLSASADHTVRAWELRTGRLLRTFTGHAGGVVGLVVTPDGRRLVSGDDEGGILVFEIATGRRVGEVEDAQGIKTVQSLALSPDGRLLAAGYLGGNTVVFELASRKRLRAFRGARAEFSPDGKSIWVGGTGKLTRHDLGTGAAGQELDPGGEVLAIAATRDGRSLVVGGWSREGRVFEPATGKLLRALPGGGGFVNDLAISPDGRLAVTASNRLRLFSLETGALLQDLGTRTDLLQAVELTAHRALIGGIMGTIAAWDLDSLRQVSFVPSRGSDSVVAFSRDGTRAIVRQDQRSLARDVSREARVVDVTSGRTLEGEAPAPDPLDPELRSKMLAAIERRDLASPLAVAADGRLAAAGSMEGVVQVWDAERRSLTRTLSAHRLSVTALAFSPDGKLLATGSHDMTVKVWEVSSGRLVRELRGHRWSIKALDFGPDGRLLLSGSSDGTARLWRLDDGASCLLMSSLAGEWIVATDDGLFDASANGARLLGMADGMRGYGIEQLAVRNNRPGRLLERMSLGSPELRAHYESLFRRRLEKLGLTEKALAGEVLPPSATFEKVKRIDDRAVEVTFAAADPHGLASYQLYVNGVPELPGVGQAVRGTKRAATHRIALGPGDNQIEGSAMGLSGQESLRALVSVAGPSSAARELYFVGFGVSSYADDRIPDLSYAHKDVADLAKALGGAAGFAKVHVRTHTDGEVTTAAIGAAKALVGASRPEDVVVLFIAGHGLHDEARPPNYYFLTHDARVDALAESAAPFERFEELLAAAPARQRLFWMDTCESGERDEGEPRGPSGGGGAIAARGLGMAARPTGGPSRTPRPWLLAKDRLIDRDLGRRTGAIVLSSSRGSELSFESAALENGLFTEAMLGALSGAADLDKSGAVSMDELRRHVSSEVARLSGDLQHPTVDRDNLWARIELPVR